MKEIFVIGHLYTIEFIFHAANVRRIRKPIYTDFDFS